MTLDYVRSKPTMAVVKSLALIGTGPVGLLHTQKVRNEYKKPTQAKGRLANQGIGRSVYGAEACVDPKAVRCDVRRRQS